MSHFPGGRRRPGLRARRTIVALVAAVGLLWLASMVLGVSWNQGSGRAAPPPSTPPARVLGFLVADLTRAQGFGSVIAEKGRGIYVPNVHVYLRDATRGTIAKTLTDLSGRFEFHSVRSGRDQVCWKERGFLAGCTPAFGAGGTDRFLGNQLIRPALGTGRTTFYGLARFKDGSIPRTWEPMANVNAFVAIRALTGLHTTALAHVNNYGEYVLPAVAAPSKTRLVATIEHAVAQTFAGTPSPPLLRRIDFTLPNTPPKIAGIFGSSGAGHHWTALPGAKIQLQAIARDADADPITVRWIFPDGTSTPAPAGSTATTFTLPNEIGAFQFHAVAYDGKGGYATDVVEISTHGVRFSGIVKATNAPVVPGATVEIGGRTTTTDGAGRFALVVKEAPRYVVDISKGGYAPVSAIYNTGILGGIWTLTRASVAKLDPTQPIDATNRRIPSDCPALLSSRVKGKQKPQECGPGIRVLIPANSLVDAAGNPPAGPVDVALATVDLGARDQMPGDYSVLVGGKLDRMDSWGAGYVEISAGGTRYNLRPGATAKVVIPIAPEQLASGGPMPSPIPLLTYDTRRGVWIPEGKAVRSGAAYVASVNHFSFINIDIYQPNPACIRVDAVGMRPEFDLRVTGHDSTSGAPIVMRATFDNSTTRFHVIGYVPPNDPNVKFEALVKGTNTPIVLALPNPTNIQPPPTTTVLTVNSGPPSAGFPPFPYTACRGFSGPTPGPLPSAVLVEATLPPNVVNEFLAGPFGNGAENLTANPGAAGKWQAQAQQYYETIDPLHKRWSVGDFRDRNQFGTGTGEVTAAYANSADLGFGREMHCQQRTITGLAGVDVACYVTNYGNKDSDDFDDFVKALAGLNAGPLGTKQDAIATVGMEFSRIEDKNDPSGNTFVSNTRVVKFYVWAGPPTGPNTGNHLAAAADLDGFGARPVPQLCQTCHGGHFGGASNSDGTPQWTATSADLKSNFIAFDLRGLTTPTYLGTDYKADQQDDFLALNKNIVDNATNRAVHDVIAKMYPTGTTPQDENSEVGGWSTTSGSPSPHDFYRDVVAPSCRNCHMSQDTTAVTGPSPTSTPNDFDQGSEVGGGFPADLVCNKNVMPNALITHRRFWLSAAPHQPELFKNYMAAHGGAAQVAHCQ